MFAAWRQWAVEEGLGGMDIIETRWGEGSDKGPDSWKGHPPDAVNEFAPHAGGRDQSMFSALKRMARVYHRGTLVSLSFSLIVYVILFRKVRLTMTHFRSRM